MIRLEPGLLLALAIRDLPLVNALLNTVAALLLVWGYALIKRRREAAHRRVMLLAFAVSVVFLASYLTYHFNTEAVTRFSGPPNLAWIYYAVLVSHVVLAAVVPLLAIRTIYLGLRDRRAQHIRLARLTWPIWLYVSVTGVVIYLVLYQIYPPRPQGRIIRPLPAASITV